MASSDRVRVKGLDIHRPIIYGNTAWVLTQKEREALPTPDHTHRWTVAVRSATSAPDSDIVGGADDLSHFIKRVTFKLHDTYTNPNRTVDKPPFEVSETGYVAFCLVAEYARLTARFFAYSWGEFEITIRIMFVQESGEKSITFYHHLKLHPWTAPGSGEPEIPPLDVAAKMGPVHSWQYDEIVFHEPYQAFLNILTAHPPKPLPKTKRRPVPFHTANPGSLEASKGGVPEFTQEMEKEEAERLEAARVQLAKEYQRLQLQVLQKEAELSQVKKEIESATQVS
ncbi:Protein AF-9 -like protein [Trametes pubescens]|uniref:Protein AF-9 homolog n=1 Tax=Trametes pubescens TaxID=154538 RepID=A0A1M2VCU2_TRAPU|nr:Protein AF-9 -like protein [Trametes pubescens]